jgi:NADPH-dependent F420 reductase
MTIAILGAGNMGKGLGKRLAEAGEDVVLIARNEAKTAEVAKSLGKNVRAGSPSEAADADIVILAVPYQNAGDAITEAGGLSGRILIDISNAVGPDMSQAITGESSAAEEIQRLAPKAKVVKAFNTIFASLLEGMFHHNGPQVFMAGDDKAAKEKVATLIKEIGFEPVDAGPLANARQVEAIGNLNIKLAYALGHGNRIAIGVSQF